MSTPSQQAVYLETSVISYLTSRPSRDLVVAARQRLTADWWRDARPHCRPFVSSLVIEEARLGDADSARRRLQAIERLPSLEPTPTAIELARLLGRETAIPASAFADALHVAIAAAHRVDFLLTWNCKHLANARIRHSIERILRDRGYDPPVLCTPEELQFP